MENKELKDRFIDKKTRIEYTLVGDYYLPNLVIEPLDLCQVFRHIFLRIFIHFFKLRLRNCYKY